MSLRAWKRLTAAALLACMAGTGSAQIIGDTGGQVRLRRPAGAGEYYPDEPYALQQAVRKLMNEAPGTEPGGKLLGVVTPHAPYGFAGSVIGSGLKYLQPGQYDRVIVLGPAHEPGFQECSIADVDAYATPLGLVPIDKGAVEILRYSPLIKNSNVDYRRGKSGIQETNVSIEVVLPFLQEKLGLFRLVPIVVGDLMTGTGGEAAGRVGAVAKAIREIMDDRTLVVATCNFTHYGEVFDYTPFGDAPETQVRKLDEDLFARVLAQDAESLAKEIRRTQNRISGETVLQIMMLLMPDDCGGMIAGYETSGRKTGRWENSISFGTLIFNDPKGTPPQAFPERKLTELTGPVARPEAEAAPVEEAPSPQKSEAELKKEAKDKAKAEKAARKKARQKKAE